MARITDAEEEVMRILWARSPLTAEDIIADISQRQQWSPATVKTFLNRLLRKKAVAAEREGKKYLYRPLVRQEDHVDAESRGLLDRFFDGRLAPLVLHFTRDERLDHNDLAELKRLIGELDDRR